MGLLQARKDGFLLRAKEIFTLSISYQLEAFERDA